jgi:hypothetical protein
MFCMPDHDAMKTKSCSREQLSEATMGFEPMIRVLQTLAFPLGHVAIRFKIADCRLNNLQSTTSNHQSLSGRWDSNPRPTPWQGVVLPLNYARINMPWMTDLSFRPRVPRARIELATPRFSVACSTN